MTWFSIHSYRKFFLNQETNSLKLLAQVIERQLPEVDSQDFKNKFQNIVVNIRESSNIRVTLISSEGNVWSDSHEHPEEMDNHLNRPEVAQALEQGVGVSYRLSETLQSEMLYVALMRYSNEKRYIIRTSQIASALEKELTDIYENNAWFLILIVVAIVALAWTISKKISRPLEDIIYGVGMISKGNFTIPLSKEGYYETDKLSRSINQMARQLDERLSLITKQKSEQDAVLSSMKEAVIGLDKNSRMMMLNESALKLIGSKRVEILGKKFSEVIRNREMLNAEEALRTDHDEIELDLEWHYPDHRYLQLRGCRFMDQSREMSGILFVLSDITRLRRLEALRTEFVANVSHELKTPLTSIKGYIETLLEEVENEGHPHLRFFQKISHNANRLQNLIDDLLILSRVEREGLSEDDLQVITVNPFIAGIVKEISATFSKEILWDPNEVKSVELKGHPQLLHQAVANLIDNAVKYGGESDVLVKTFLSEENEVCIQVIDSGPGIAAQHHAHLFQRFYRVDKARSRASGGTGLGLSIVKHIAQAHYGSVSIESELGQGACFSIVLPRHLP